MEHPYLLGGVIIFLITLAIFIVCNVDKFDRFFAHRVIISVTRITVVYSCTLRCRCEEWEMILERISKRNDHKQEVSFASLITELMDEVRGEMHRSGNSPDGSKLRLCYDALIGWDERVREVLSNRLYYRQYKVKLLNITKTIQDGLDECS